MKIITNSLFAVIPIMEEEFEKIIAEWENEVPVV